MNNTADLLKQVDSQLKMAALSMAAMVFHGTGTDSKEVIKQAKEIEKYIKG